MIAPVELVAGEFLPTETATSTFLVLELSGSGTQRRVSVLQSVPKAQSSSFEQPSAFVTPQSVISILGVVHESTVTSRNGILEFVLYGSFIPTDLIPARFSITAFLGTPFNLTLKRTSAVSGQSSGVTTSPCFIPEPSLHALIVFNSAILTPVSSGKAPLSGTICQSLALTAQSLSNFTA